MSRLGTNPNISSDVLESKMLPDVEGPKPEGGSEVDLMGDGVHKIYLSPWQLEVRNFGARNTKIRAGRGTGKTSYIGVHMVDVTIGLPRQMGGFIGSSAKQLFTRTMPNALKVVNQMGFTEGVFYFRGQPPAKLKWPMPLAKPRVWENVVAFQNGFVWEMLSMAVRGSGAGLNLAALIGDEAKYLPWERVKGEIMPTLRGDFLPPEYRKTERKAWGRGTDPKMNHHWLSQLWVSDAGLTQRECLWEKEKEHETKEVNAQIAEMLAELKYLQRHNPRMAAELAQNDNFLKRLHLLRRDSEAFFNLSSIENAAMLGGEAWIRQQQRELPDLLFRLTILGQEKGAAKDGFYCNFDIEIHGYVANDADTERLIKDRYTHKTKGTALDGQRWPTKYETEALDYDEIQRDGETCDLDVDLDYDSPLLIAIDANANLNCMVVGQTRFFEGRDSLMILKSFFALNERKLRSLVQDFSAYYAPFRRRGGTVIFYYDATIKQGASTSYATEGSIDSRFDRVVLDELKRAGWKNVIDIDTGAPIKHASRYQMINDCLAFATSPAIRINREKGRNDYLICAIENAGVDSATFKKDKSKEKLKNTDEDSLGGDPRQRTDITDAMDALITSVKIYGVGRKKIGRSLAIQGIRLPELGGIVG